jgi:signal peptidase II
MNPTLVRTLAIAAVIFALDRASKIWVVERLDLANRLHIEVLHPWLNLSMAWNQGVNFGMFDLGPDGWRWLVAVALAVVAGLLYWVRRLSGWTPAIGAGLVVGGALGNVWDRFQWGAVADFVNMSCCGIRNPFAFNLADAAIFLGVFVLVAFPGDAPPKPRRRSKGRA